MQTNVLFVCSKNQWRSPTAEVIYRKDPRVLVRSRGTSRSAIHPLTASDLRWADLVLAMESKHRERIRADHPRESRHKPMHVLDIPDEYRFMDPELVDQIRLASDHIIDEFHQASEE